MKRFLTMCAGILLICQFTPPLTLAQNAGYEVKGVVVDKSGMPILGATVVEKGTTNGVSTGINGRDGKLLGIGFHKQGELEQTIGKYLQQHK